MRIYPSLLAACLCLAVVAGDAYAQPSPKPFTKDEVVKLLTGNVPAKRVGQLVRERGIDFQVTPQTEDELRSAGADNALVATLKELAPKNAAAAPPPASPPTLTITSSVGHSRVYVDDEVIGTTSSEGRLKISTLAPGQHRVRVSLDGYQEFEEVVGLSAGQNFDFRADLKPNSLPAPPTTNSGQAETSNNTQRFRVAELGYVGKHRGWLTISDRVKYQSDRGTTPAQFAVHDIANVQSKSVALGMGDFFVVQLSNGEKYQFVYLDSKGRATSPAPIIDAIRRAMAQSGKQ